jgi:3-phosphoshikimate 1-carboxyvinyltransferase
MTVGRTDLRVQPATRPLTGGVPVPCDKSIAHRGLLLGAIATGQTELRNFSAGDGNLATLHAIQALGAPVEEIGPGALRITGHGLLGLSEPAAPIDCGGSGTTIRMLAGLLAGQHFRSILAADEYLSQRPMARVVGPLRRRGASVEGRFHPTRGGEVLAPLEIGPLPPGQALIESEEQLPIPTAQVKSALLLSGLYADGNTYVSEPLVSRDHTERLLRALGVPIEAVATMVQLDVSRWSRKIPAFAMTIPGDFSAAAFLIGAALLVPGSQVAIRDCGLNPTRRGLLDYLRDAGANLSIEERADSLGEPVGVISAGYGALQGGLFAGELLVRGVDEVPVLCAIAARSHGVTEIADAAELRVKESDRLAAMARVLRAFGVECEERRDGLIIQGRPEGALTAAEVESGGDHRIAMTAALLGLVADGESCVRDAGCIATSFPRFAGTLRALGADLRAVEA